MNKFIIQDWAGNIMNEKGFFKPIFSCAPRTFDSFDEAWEFVYADILGEMSDEEYESLVGEYYVTKCEEKTK